MKPLTWLPRAFEYLERAYIFIATRGWHRPAFYLTTLFTAPLALYLYRKETRFEIFNIFLKVLANVLLIFSIIFLLQPRLWIFFLLLPLGRIARFFYIRLRIHEEETRPVQWKEAIVIETDEEAFSRPRLKFALEKMDLLSLLFILFIFLSFLINADLFAPFGDDCWYHLAVARKFIELDGIPLWDTWEFQPVGRPHLYPPLLHILIVFFSQDYEHVVEGAKVLQVFLYPAALLTSWYFTRLLFSSRVAFIALVILSMDFTFLILFIGVMPSSLVNLIFPLLVISFLSKRLKTSVFLMMLCLYSHLSFPFLVLVCLFTLSLKYRTYLSFYKKFLVLSLLTYVPWALRVIVFRDFLRSFATIVGNPVLGLLVGMISLQIFNPILLYCAYKGLKKSSGINRDLVKYILIGFLPALFFYGGRYWFHTSPFWAIFIALFLEDKIFSRKRTALLIFCGLIPMPLVAIGLPGGGSLLLPGITGLDNAMGMHLLPQFFPPAFDEYDLQLKEFIEQYTSPAQVIHVDEAVLADKLVVLTGRSVDNGMWFEVGSEEAQKAITYSRLNERPAVFVYLDREKLPPVDKVFSIGKYWIGVRA